MGGILVAYLTAMAALLSTFQTKEMDEAKLTLEYMKLAAQIINKSDSSDGEAAEWARPSSTTSKMLHLR